MRRPQSAFIAPVQFRLSLRSIAARSVVPRRARHGLSRVVCMSSIERTPFSATPAASAQQHSDTKRAQECITAFLKQMQETHTALQGRRPPALTSIVPLLSAFKELCLLVQAPLDRSLPGMSYLDRAIALAKEETTSPRELARLLKPNGRLRTLCGAAMAALSQARSSSENASVDEDTPEPLRAARAVVIRHSSLRLRGLAERRNPAWRALMWEAMRAHPAVSSLPETASLHVTRSEQLCLLRQDGQAFVRSREVFPLHADNIWRLLGFAEDEAIAKLGETVPPNCRGHRHALEGWQAFFGGARGQGDAFRELYRVSHVPNVMLSYLAAAKEAFDTELDVRARWASPVQVRETGLVVAPLISGGALAASPIGWVLRRRKEDFWAWAEREDGVLLAHTEMVFRSDGTGYEFGVARPRTKLDAVSFLEAQVSMLVCGEEFRRADVVWHGVLGGTRTFRVERDEKLLQLVVRGVGRFCERFVGEKPRPPERGFQTGEEFDELVERVGQGCESARCVYDVMADVDEMRLEEWREGMGDWVRRKNEMPFLHAKRKRDEVCE